MRHSRMKIRSDYHHLLNLGDQSLQTFRWLRSLFLLVFGFTLGMVTSQFFSEPTIESLAFSAEEVSVVAQQDVTDDLQDKRKLQASKA